MQHNILINELLHHIFNVEVSDPLLPVSDGTDEVIFHCDEAMLEVDAVLVPVDDFRSYLEDLEHFDESPVSDGAVSHDDHAVLLAHVLEYIRPDQEVCLGEIQLSQVFSVVHMEHPYVYVGCPAYSIVISFIQDMDFLLEQNAVYNA